MMLWLSIQRVTIDGCEERTVRPMKGFDCRCTVQANYRESIHKAARNFERAKGAGSTVCGDPPRRRVPTLQNSAHRG